MPIDAASRTGDRPAEGAWGRLLPYGLLALAALCWAGNFVLARGVVEILPPVAFAFTRWALALLILLPFARRRLAADWPQLRAHAGRLALLAVLGVSAWTALLYAAVHATTAINAALIQASMPAFIVVSSRLLFGDRIRPIQGAGVLFGFAGAAVIVRQGAGTGAAPAPFAGGDLLVLAAVLCYALYSVLLRWRPAIHPVSFLAATFGLGAAALFPAYLLERAVVGPFALTAEAAASILYVALFPSIVAYFCWNRGVDRVGANRAGLFMNLIPVFTAGLSILLLGERPRGFHALGMGLIVLGMGLFYVTAAGAVGGGSAARTISSASTCAASVTGRRPPSGGATSDSSVQATTSASAPSAASRPAAAASASDSLRPQTPALTAPIAAVRRSWSSGEGRQTATPWRPRASA